MPTTPTNTVTINVTDQASLVSAIEAANTYANTNVVLQFAVNSTIRLTGDLPLINIKSSSLLTIEGNNSTINGGGTYRGLFAYAGASAIDNLNIVDTVASGGAGGTASFGNYQVGLSHTDQKPGGAGGGGAGLGGGLFVGAAASVTIDNVNFTDTAAKGGVGGSTKRDGNYQGGFYASGGYWGGGGGGGGLGGNGGTSSNGTTGGGGGGGIGVGANGSSNWNNSRDGASGSAVGLGSGGSGGGTYHTNHYLVTSTTSYSHGGGGGYSGGAGGDGYDVGGGGGGIGAANVPYYYTGSSGLSLSLNFSPSGLVTNLLAIADIISPEAALFATVVVGLYGAIGGQLGAPGFLNDADFTLDGNGLHRDPAGANIPGLEFVVKKLTQGQVKYLLGFGLHVDYTQNGPNGAQPAGGDGGFGGGGGGGGRYSQGGWGGFGSGGGGSGASANYGFGGAGGFGGGGGGYVNTGKYSGPGAPGFGAGATTGRDGGGGLGAGGAIFVQDGGSLTYAGSGAMTGQSVQGGAGGGSDASAGSAYGQGVFLQGGSSLNLAPTAGNVIKVGAIADEAGSNPSYAPKAGTVTTGPSNGGAVEGSVDVSGAGTVQLTGVNTYLGGTTLKSGTLELASGASLNPAGSIFADGGALKVDAGDTLATTIVVQNTATDALNVTLGTGATFTGSLTGIGAGQYVRFRGLTGAGVLEADIGGFTVAQATLVGGVTYEDAHTYTAQIAASGEQDFTVSNTAQLGALVNWIGGFDAAIQVNGSPVLNSNTFVINLTPQVGDTSSAAQITLPTFLAGVTINASGVLADGGDTAPAANTVISATTLTLSNTTPLTLSAASGQTLTVQSAINQSGGAAGLKIAGAGLVDLTGANSFTGGVTVTGGSLEISTPQALGRGAVTLSGSHTTLIVDSAALPANTIAGFTQGDTIDLKGVTVAATYLTANAAGVLTLNPALNQTLNFTGLVPGARFALTSDGHGGTDITSLEWAYAAATVSALNTDLATFPTAPNADDQITLAPGTTFTASQALAIPNLPTNGRLTINGSGDTLNLPSADANGLEFSSGEVILQNLSLQSSGSNAVTVDAGARVVLSGVTTSRPMQVAAGGSLIMRTGTVETIFDNGAFAAAPLAGQTVDYAGAVYGGDLIIGDVGASVNGVPNLVGGVVSAEIGATVGGAVHLTTDTTLDIKVYATLGYANIDFDSAVGARLLVEGDYLPRNTISFTDNIGAIEIYVANLSGPHILTVTAADTLQIPGSYDSATQNANASLRFSGGVTPGEQFVIAPGQDGDDWVVARNESTTISTEGQLYAVDTYINALPLNAGLNVAVGLSGTVKLVDNGQSMAPPSGVSVNVQGTGGLEIGVGVTYTLAGANTFSGGVVLDGQSNLTAVSAAALGAGTITFVGANPVLTVQGSAAPANVIDGFSPSDTLILSGVTALQSGFVYTDANGVATFATASGAVSLHFGDLPIDTPISVQAHGAAGTVLTTVGRQTLTVATEAQLDAAITSADAYQGQTIINLAAGATISLTTVLASIKLAANQSLVIHGDGATINGQGAQGGFYVAAGHVAIDNLSLVNLLAQGGGGQDNGWAGGGGAGLGGALFVGSAATVNLDGVAFLSDKAVGGAGGSSTQSPADGAGGGVDVNTAAVGAMGGGGVGNGGTGGTGSFGGGGGGNNGAGGFAGGAGDRIGDGGGGAGLGGAIFIQQGGSLVIGGAISESGGQAVGGAGRVLQADFLYAGSGLGLGAAIFSQGAATITMAPAAGQTSDLADQIADTNANGGSGGALSVVMAGSGVLELDGANSYSGTTTIQSGTLVLTGAMQGLTGGIIDNSLLKLNAAASTTYSGAITGAGSLIVSGGAVTTVTGAITIGGAVTVQSGGLTVSGPSLSASAIIVTGTLAFGGGSSLSVAAPITGTGDIVYGDTGSSTFANVSTTGALTVRAGRLAINGANAFASVTLAGGALELQSPLTVAGQVAYAAGAGSGLIVDAGVAIPATLSGFTYGDSLDLRGQTIVSASLAAANVLQLTLASGAQTDITVNPGQTIANTVYHLAADGAGGTTITPQTTQFPVTTAAALNSAILAFNPGGLSYQTNTPFTIDFQGRDIDVSAGVTAIDLPSSSSLTINNAGVLYTQDAYFHGQTTDQKFEVAGGSVFINSGDFRTVGVDLQIDPGASLTLANANYLGFHTSSGTVDNGTLSVSGGTLFYGLSGSGSLILNNGTYYVQGGGFSFGGALTLNSAYLPGEFSATFASLTLGGGSDIWLHSLPASVTFEPGDGATLDLGNFGNGVVYGMQPNDLIYLAQSTDDTSGSTQDSLVQGSGQLSANNTLSFYAYRGQNDGVHNSYLTETIQFDPGQNFAGEVFTVANQKIRLAPAAFTVSTAAQLAAAIQAIDVNGSSSALNAHYTITLTGDLTNAAAMAANMPAIHLATGDTLTIDGQGHTISGVNAYNLFNIVQSQVTLENLTLIAPSPTGTAVSYTSLSTQALTLESVNILQSTVTGAAANLTAYQNPNIYYALGTNGFLNYVGRQPNNANVQNIIAAPGAGQVMTLSVTVTSGGFVLNGPGTLDLTAATNTFAGGITVNGGTLELGGARSAGTGVITLAANAEIIADSAAPAVTIGGMAVGQGEIDFKALAPSAITITRSGGNTIINGATVLSGVTAPVAVTTDGLGGALVYVDQSAFTTSDEPSLNQVLGQLNLYGAHSAPGAADTLTLAPPSGTLTLNSLVQPVALAAGASLTVQGGGAVLDGGGGAEAGLAFSAGQITVSNLTFSDFGPNQTALSIAGSASAVLNGVSFTDAGDAAPVLAAGAADAVRIVAANFAGGAYIELGQGAILTLAPATGATLTIAAAIDDPAGDGTGSASGAVVISGHVVLQTSSDFTGGTTVSGTLELAGADAAGLGAISLGTTSVLVVDAGVSVANVINGLQAGATIDLKGVAVTAATTAGQITTFTGPGTSVALNLGGASFDPVDLTFASDRAGGTLVGYAARQLASVSATTSINLGAVHIGGYTETVSVTNTAGVGGEVITGGFGALDPNLRGQGSVNLAPGQSGSLNLGVVAGAEGAFSQTANLALSSNAAGRQAATDATSPITVTGTAYALAAPSAPTSLNLGVGRVGGPALTGTVTVGDTGTLGDPYQEALGYTVTDAADPAVSITGGAGTIAAGATATVGISLATNIAAGVVSDLGSIANVSLGAGTSGLANTRLATSALAISATLYNPAVAQMASALTFGVVHVGDVVSRDLNVSNTAITGGYTDGLDASVLSAPGGYSLSGTVAGVAAGASSAFTFSLNTSTSGVFNGSASIGLASEDSAQANLSLGTRTVAITGAVDSYAVAGLSQTGGPVAMTGSNGNYTLDFGTVIAGQTATFSLANIAPGLADLLSANVTVAGGAGFTNAGLTGISGLGAGQGKTLSITVNPSLSGNLSETLTITPTGSNASGYSGALAPITLTLKATVPSTNFTATSEADLNNIIADIDLGGGLSQTNTHYSITLNPAGGTLSLTTAINAINLASGSSLSITGAGGMVTIGGGSAQQGFIDQTGSLALQDLTLKGMVAQGGAGASGQYGGGGGGAGLGGALYIASGASATLANVQFVNDGASGGAGGVYAAGGQASGGGGLDGVTAPTGTAGGTSPVAAGQGGAGMYATLDYLYGNLVGGSLTAGVAGGFGGGGGANNPSASPYEYTLNTANGTQSGFGGGAGSGNTYTEGSGSFGGGSAGYAGGGEGGGGLAAGGDVFVQQGASLTILSGDLSAGALTGGAGGGGGSGAGAATAGGAAGSSIFYQGGGTLSLDPMAGQVDEVDGTIASDQSMALEVGGAGKVVLKAASAFGGGTTVNGSLELAVAGAAGSGAITLNAGAVLVIDTTGAFGNTVSGLAGATIDAAAIAGASVAISGHTLTISNASQSLTVTLAESGLSYYGLSTASDGHGGTLVSETPAQSPVEALVAPTLSQTSFNFGNVHVGATSTGSLTVSNPLLQGGDTLVGGFGAVSSPMSGSGALTVIPGGSGTLSVSLAAPTIGVISGSAALALESESPSGALTPISGPTITATETAYALATPTATVTGFGAARVGGTLTGQVTITDGAASAYSESLVYSLGATGGALSDGSATGGTVAAGASAPIGLTLSTATAGTVTGTLALGFTSTGVGTSGLADTALAGTTITATGDVYAPAVAQYASTLDLGWGHVGDTLGGALSVTNAATGGLTDSLSAAWSGLGGGFAGSNTISGLGAGATDVLNVSLTSASAGVVSTKAGVWLTSHDAALSDLTLSGSAVTLTGTFLNYAQMGLTEVSGGGTLTRDGNNFTLDLGVISGPDTINLAVTNTAAGLADLLSGGFDASGAVDVTTSGLDSFSGLGAGQSDTAATITINPVVGGAFSETITLHGTDYNQYGYSAGMATQTITITGSFAGVVTHAESILVSTEDQLNADIAKFTVGGALAAINTHYVITFDGAAGTIALTSALDQINLMAGSSLTIVGNGDTLDGGGAQRGFVVDQGSVEIDNLTLANMTAQGSAGGAGGGVAGGGGGGAGLGGGLFVAGGAQVTLSGVTFTGDTAVGGAGGAGGYGNSSNAGGSPVGGLPGGIGQGGAGGYAPNFTYPRNGGFGGGGGGGATNAGSSGSYGANGGFGAGNGGNPGFASGGGGGGGLGAGGNVFVADGGSLNVIGGAIGGGTATGGAGGGNGANGQGLGGGVFLQGSGQISLDPTAGQTIELTGGLGTDGGGALTINGPGVVQTDGLTNLGGGVNIEQGTLQVTSDPAALGAAAVTDNGALVFSPPASGAARATAADTGLSANDQLSLTYFDFEGNQTSQTFGWTGDLQSLADAINSAFPGGDFSAQVNGASITISANGGDASYLIRDQSGQFLEKLGASAVSGTGNISVTGVLPPALLQASDAVDLDGQTIVVGGTGQLSDLVNAINAANVGGVTATIDGDGHLQLASPSANIVLSDAAGTPLESLGIVAGTFGSTHVLSAPVTGSGSVTINQGVGDTFVVSGAAAWSGATTISAGAVVFGGDVSQLVGAITDPGAIVFEGAGSTSLSAPISGAGSVRVDVGGTFTLDAANSFTGGLTLDAGTLVLNAAGAASTGAITFGAGEATLLLGQAVSIPSGGTFANTLGNLASTDQIDLQDLTFAAGAGAVVSGGTLTVTSGGTSYSFTLSNPGVGAFTVSNDGAGGVLLTPVGPNSLVGTAQNITANLASLLSTPGLDFITVSDNGPIILTVSQALNAGDISRLHNQDGSAVKLEVVDTADQIAANLAALQADLHVVSLTATSASAQAALALGAVTLTSPITAVRDSAADLSGAVLGRLQAIGVTAVTVQDNAPIVLSLAQFEADAAILSGLTFANGQTTATVEISDGADNAVSQLAALSADPQIASVVIGADAYNGNTLIQDSAQPLTLSLSGGGTITMNPSDSGVAKVVLMDPPSPYIFTADSEAGLQIVDHNPGPDLIIVGDPSQSVTFDYAGSIVQATAANAGVLVQGAGSGDILEITTGGAATLNPNDSDISVVLDQAGALTLAPGVNAVTGSSGDDVFVATQAQMRAGFSLDGGAGANALQLSGGGTFDLSQPAITNIQTLVVAESQDPSAQQIVDLTPGTTLQVNVATPNLDPSNANAAAVTIVGAGNSDNLNLGGAGGVVTLQAAPGGAAASTLAATLPTLGDTMTLTFSDMFVGTVTETVTWDGSLDHLASAINSAFAQAFLGSFGYANITATSTGSSLTLTANADTDYTLNISGALAGELNGPSGPIANAYAGVTYSLTPMFSPSDAVDLNGTVVTVGGVGSLYDLVSSINGAGLGVTAGIDAGGHLTLVSATGHIALSDASGSPLEALAVAAGLHADATSWGAVNGAGEAVIQQLATDNTVITGAVTATGGIDLTAGTLTLDGPVAAGSGPIIFGSNKASLALGAAATPASGGVFASSLIDFAPADTLDLKGLAFATGASAVLSEGVLTVTSGGQAISFDLAHADFAKFSVSNDGGGAALVTELANSLPVTLTSPGPQSPTYQSLGTATAVLAGVTLADANYDGVTSAQVKISAGLATGDLLNFTAQNGIVGSYNAATGALTLSGQATLAQYQAALSSITFSSTSNDASNGGSDATRTISASVDNGAGVSNLVTSTINVEPITASAILTAVNGQTGQLSLADLFNAVGAAASGALTLTSISLNPGSSGAGSLSVNTGDQTFAFTPAAGFAGPASATAVLQDAAGHAFDVDVSLETVVDASFAGSSQPVGVVTTVGGGFTTTSTYSPSGALINAYASKAYGASTVTTYYDGSLNFYGANIVTSLARGATEIQNFDGSWSQTGATITQIVGNQTIEQSFDGAWTQTGAAITTVAGNVTVTQTFNGAWSQTSAVRVDREAGSTEIQYFDANWNQTSASLTRSFNNGGSETQTFDANWNQTSAILTSPLTGGGVETQRFNASGVQTSATLTTYPDANDEVIQNFDGAWTQVSAQRIWTSGGQTVTQNFDGAWLFQGATDDIRSATAPVADRLITFDTSWNALSETDTLQSGQVAHVVYGQAGGNQTLAATAGQGTTFVFTPGSLNGDTLGGLQTISLAGSAHDVLDFEGYGAGASLVQLNATTWQVSANGLATETFQITGGAVLGNGDYQFIGSGSAVSTIAQDAGATTSGGASPASPVAASGLIVAQSSGQTLALAANETVDGAAAGGDLFEGTTASLAGDTLVNFGRTGDALDVTDLPFTGAQPTFVEAAGGTYGTLTVSNGTTAANVVLFGQFIASGFQAASDGGTGTMITYSPAITATPIAVPH